MFFVSEDDREPLQKNYTLVCEAKPDASKIEVQLTSFVFYVGNVQPTKIDADTEKPVTMIHNPDTDSPYRVNKFGCVQIGWSTCVDNAWQKAKQVARWE